MSAVTTGATDTSPTTRYAHNALGQRVFKTEPLYPPAEGDESDPGFFQSLLSFFTKLWGPGTTDAEKLGYAFMYDENGTLISETGMGGANSAGSTQYIYLPTANGPMPIAAVINGHLYAVHSDHLNTPRRLTDSQGQPVWQWAYSAFGDEKPTIAKYRFANLDENPNPGTTNISETVCNVRYPGQYDDVESGLSQNWNRYFDKRLGRYTQPDPIGRAGGWNPYPYVDGNPLTYTDPMGLMKLPNDPSGLSPEWTSDPSHRDPTGQRFRHPSGDYLDFHPGKPGKPKYQGKDHWHHNGDDWHYLPGDDVPDPPCLEEPSLYKRLLDSVSPKGKYDPQQDRWVPAPSSPPFVPVLPRHGPMFIPMP